MMKSLLLRLFFFIPVLVISFSGYCNPLELRDSIEVVFKDTTHVHGKVVDEKGVPLKGIAVSTQRYRPSVLWANTNAQGDYLLKNVQPNDTIFFDGGNRFVKIFHEGSRILNVTLPELTQRSLEVATVTAKRQMPKQPKNSTVKIEVSGGIFPNYDFGLEPYGGYSKFKKDLHTKLIYPEKARTANIEGMVKIGFVIDREGKPTEFKTVHGLGYGCEEAVIELLKETKWRPGISNGYPVPVTMSVDISFKLQDL